MLEFDGNSARRTERTYASPDVKAQRKYVMSLLAPRPGERVLDVGSGPGYLLALIAEAVGSTGAAHGLELKSPLDGPFGVDTRRRCGLSNWFQVG